MPSNYQAITKYNEEQLGRDTASRKTQISMYSDSTHFIYEILQNADDYGAKEVFFKLSKTELWIEHDGEPFTEENVEAITYFGQSTSREDLVKTGRFGVGFKSVFAFTATPIIISDCEHFKICGLYCVKEHPYPDDLPRSRTRIILPFNHESENPDYVEDLISRADAYSKIEERLTSLNKNTLLFTRNIREIRWEANDGSGHYSREDDISNNARMTSITAGEHVKKYLVFSRVPRWKDDVHKTVDIAFGIDEKGAIVPVPAEEGFLYVLFATKQETHLRFILNGPYRTNPARETISEDDSFNRHLIKETCDLVEDMLPQIWRKGLLTTKFLAVLPNKDDNKLRDFYTPIMDRLVELFNNKKLTPMKRGSHAAAKGSFRVKGSAKLSDLIDDKDLARILGGRHSSLLWIKNPQPGSQEDRFLDMLEIKKWTTQDLIDKLSEESEMIMKWLARKNYDWHRKLYVLLLDELEKLNKSLDNNWYKSRLQERRDKLLNLCIIRCSDEKYRKGKDCFFPSDGVKDDDEFPRVAKRLYSSDKDDNQRDRVCEFLKKMEVSEVEESHQIKEILKKRYSKGSIESDPQDLERFIAFAEKEPDKDYMFKKYYIFELERQDRRWWGKPKIVFLDSPYLDTGLKAYYEALDDDTDLKWALSPNYKESGIDLKKIGEFAKKVGAQTELEVKEQKIPYRHPKRNHLLSAPGQRIRNEIDEDYTIPAFEALFDKPNLDKARLIWQTMDSLSSIYLTAKYRKSKNKEFHYAESSLVHDLRNAEWVPQKCGESQHMPDEATKRILAHDLGKIEWIPQKQGKILGLRFVRPCDASSELLPEDFSHHHRREWIRKVEFGENARKKSEDHIALTRNVQKIGFASADSAKRWAEIEKMGISPDEVRSKFMSSPEFPTRSVSNPERRQATLAEQFRDAPEKEYEPKQRNVRRTRGEIDPRTYLKNQYTNDDDQMICQICQEEMPFKKRDGDYYFEVVEAFSKDDLPKEHNAQFLALCPECEARYKEFVKNDKDTMKRVYDVLKNSDALEIALQLGELKTSLRFVETHRQDIRTILQNERHR